MSQVHVLELADVQRALPELIVCTGFTNRTRFLGQVIAPLLEAGLLERTIPEKPRSSKQQYRTTEAGRRAIERLR